MMSDGPSCLPADKFYGHSLLHYSNTSDEEASNPRDATKFGLLWSQAQKHAADQLKKALKMSEDVSSFIGVQVLEQQYTFILKFYMYDTVSLEHDYPIAKSFGKIYSPTVELIVSFPLQVMLS